MHLLWISAAISRWFDESQLARCVHKLTGEGKGILHCSLSVAEGKAPHIPLDLKDFLKYCGISQGTLSYVSEVAFVTLSTSCIPNHVELIGLLSRKTLYVT